MQGRWRIFRHEAGQAAGPPAWAYVALFGASLLLGVWSAGKYNAVVMWPANGVLLAAFLQLHRRKAIAALSICLVLNVAAGLVRGDPPLFLWLNVALNFAQVFIAGTIARRVCGAALDLRRPRRLLAFATLAVTPAVLFCTLIAVNTVAVVRDYPAALHLFTFQRFFAMEALGLLTITPILLLLARRHRFRNDVSSSGALEATGLMAMVAAVAIVIFAQSSAPLLFLIFPAGLLLVFRMSPTAAAISILMITVIGGFATLNGHGPMTLQRIPDIPDLARVPDVLHHLQIFYAFVLTMIVTALPTSTIVSERRRMMARLEARARAARTAMRQAEAANAAKSRFLALMSHEMRTPLHAVVGYSELLTRRPGLAREARAQADEIQRSGAALLTLVEDVLEISRGDTIACLDSVDPAILVEEVCAAARDAAAAKGLPIRSLVRSGAGAAVLADPRRLRQILNRLIANAIKFTARGEILVTVAREGDITVLRVTDTGPGIDTALAVSLFQPFVQADDTIGRAHVGAGLGLAVARRLARDMGGDIVLEGSSPLGSTFAVRLPLPPATTEPAPAPRTDSHGPARPEAPLPAARVLIVDDHPANREVARLMLSPLGCQTFEATDGEEAVVMASTAPFDLILMDVRMPGMDGLAATRAIRALPGLAGRTPILAVTADAMPEDAARCLDAGMNGHLAKPITHASLFDAIGKVTANSSPAVPNSAAA
ncbi:response regulator [Brevundimonas sp. R86498]|uniref:response regulator n=1 Tax=Brevundimonas sp. R86498 TaxID=3093845 RepID=UPI0037CBFEAD